MVVRFDKVNTLRVDKGSLGILSECKLFSSSGVATACLFFSFASSNIMVHISVCVCVGVFFCV